MASNGVCLIKPEFILPEHERQISLECVSNEDKANIEDSAEKAEVINDKDEEIQEPCYKKQKLSKREKKKLRGQNKARPLPFKRDITLELCKVLTNIAENEDLKTCQNERCSYLHDIQEYLKLKPTDISNDCFNYKVCGRCPWGLACRFASAHTKTDGRNIVDQTVYEQHRQKQPTTLNILTQELQNSLRKRMYDFKTSEDVIKNNDKLRQSKINSNSKTDEKHEPKSSDVILHKTESDISLKVVNNCISQKTSGTVTDEDVIKLRTSEKKKIEWQDKLVLTPLTTVGNLPFRRICKEFGADVTCGEMAMSASLLQGASQEWALTKKHHTEDIFGVQLCGNNPHVITKSAQVLQENMEIDFIDLNLGCPIDLVYRQGGGSGLLRRERVLESIVRCTSQVLNIPLTVKTRTGVYGDQNIAHKLVPKFRDWGVSMVTIHGRSREQRYTRIADWPYIDKCASLSTPMPVFGNGDILSYEDYKYARENYKNVAGVAIGRGALLKPWLFTEIKEQKLWDISSSERFDILKKYANYGLEHWGSDTKGVENTRRFMLEWLSFLYRYVPVGILERPPQRINERPPFYKGRDDLETLMASSSCADWIKISEMLLGPVPENFNFLPKHKANSYK